MMQQRRRTTFATIINTTTIVDIGIKGGIIDCIIAPLHCVRRPQQRVSSPTMPHCDGATLTQTRRRRRDGFASDNGFARARSRGRDGRDDGQARARV
jgi:hypothetical protein